MQKLIFKSNGIFQGDDEVMGTIENFTSICGIPHYQLYKKVLKEYNKHRSIYDMDHNKHLLTCVTFRLARECDMLTLPSNDDDIEKALSIAKFRIPVHHSADDKIRFPVLPWPALDAIKELVGQASIYAPLDANTKKNLYANLIISFYSDWHRNIRDNRAWVFYCLNAIMNFVPEEHRVQANNIFERTSERFAKEKGNIVTHTYLIHHWWEKPLAWLKGLKWY